MAAQWRVVLVLTYDYGTADNDDAAAILSDAKETLERRYRGLFVDVDELERMEDQ